MSWLRQNKIVVIVITILAIALIAAAVSKRTVVNVRAETTRQDNIVNTISTNGKIEPEDNFEAHALAPASVKKVFVKEGDKVKAGQLLVQLDDAEARAQAARALAQLKAAESDISSVGKGGSQEELLTNQANLTKARAERDSAQRNLSALQKLQQTGSASAGEVQEAESRLQRAQAEFNLLEQRKTGRYSSPEVARVQAQAGEARAAYAAAQELIKNTNITAPRSGTVYSLPVRAGQFVNAGDLLVQVAQLDKMQVRAFVDEPEIGKLSTGQKVTLTWDAVPGRTWEGIVARVPTSVTMRGTRSVGEVVCAVSNKDLKLLPNVNVNVLITTERRDNVLSVSREAVISAEGKKFVYTIDDGRLHRKEVETGVSSLTRIEVKKGIGNGSLVALGAVGSQPMAEGVEAKVVEKVN